VEIAGRMTAPAPEPRREEAFRPFTAWMRAAICKAAARGFGLPSPANIARAHGGNPASARAQWAD